MFVDVSEAILYPLNEDQNAKTDAWVWYRDSSCASVGGPASPPTHVLHKGDVFSINSYDPRWMSGIALPLKVKRTLWNAHRCTIRLRALRRMSSGIMAGRFVLISKDGAVPPAVRSAVGAHRKCGKTSLPNRRTASRTFLAAGPCGKRKRRTK
jgi:hypothetical protein